MAYIEAPAVQEGDSVINMDPSTKLWPDYKAEGDEYALITMHTMPFEGSVGLINQLTATRLNRKGFHTAILLYGPAVLMAAVSRMSAPRASLATFSTTSSLRSSLRKAAKFTPAASPWPPCTACANPTLSPASRPFILSMSSTSRLKPSAVTPSSCPPGLCSTRTGVLFRVLPPEGRHGSLRRILPQFF